MKPSQPPATQRRASAGRGNLILVVMMAAGTAAFLGLSFWPTKQEMSRLQQELYSNREQMEQALLLPARLDRTREDIGRTTRFVSAWREAGGESTSALFASISHAISQHGALTTQFVPEPPVQRRYLRETAIRITCRGTLEQIFAALQSLESLPCTLWVDELRLAPDRDDQAKLTCELKLGIFAEKSDHSD